MATTVNKAVRALTMGGLGLLAGAALGAPALAADHTPNASVISTTSAVSQYLPAANEVVGFYNTLRGCTRAGWIGEQRGFWQDSACVLIRTGIRRGAWALQVQRDDWRWGAPGFRAFYSGNQFRFRGDGFLGNGPRFNNWIRGPIANSPFGNCDDDGDYPGENDYDIGAAYGGGISGGGAHGGGYR
ncbi:hypothetical protein [Actinoplanes xinjiangensis]|uniref:hypothetical protein n=1 Tax=Actinoplanes xinjiangensis TaxID=512350 RepID=UPI003434A50D